MGRREWYRSISKGEKEIPGCMSGMLHFFDFHRILFTPSSSSGGNGGRAAQVLSPQQLHQYSSQLKGVEAPRNSLELGEAAAATATSTASALAEEYYGIPIGIQVNSAAAPCLLKKQNKKKKELLQLVGEEKRISSQSETPRTPNVVARLMGLEILPDGATTPTLGSKSQVHSPRISMNRKTTSELSPRPQPLQKRETNLLPTVRSEMGYRSLPDTPRASAERSRDTDPRLSLQINKENNHNNRATYLCEAAHSLPLSPTGGYMNKPRRSKESSFKFQDANKSPRSHCYAREIVKEVKENIHHRRENSNASGGTGDRLNKSRRTRPADKRVTVENIDTEQCFIAKPSPSTSPPPQGNIFFDTPYPQVPPKPTRPQPALPYKAGEQVEAKTIKMEPGPASKCKKASYEKFTERIKRQPPQSEAATQSDSLLGRITPPVPSSSSPSILDAFTQKHSSKEASHRTPLLASPKRVRPTHEQESFLIQRRSVDAKEQDPEFLYVKSILERGGIMSTATRQGRWYSPSPSLPIDPFVFHQLELDLPLFRSLNGHEPLRHRCNRKLLFHLVEELLSDLLSWSLKPHKKIKEELLLDWVWSQIRGFPLADCQVIQDIDALVAGDLVEAKVRRLLGHPLVAAEAERVALEIEEDVLDSVVGEAAETLAPWAKLQR